MTDNDPGVEVRKAADEAAAALLAEQEAMLERMAEPVEPVQLDLHTPARS